MVATMSGMGSVDSSLFYKLIDNVLSNWSALQLAIGHGMGGQDSEAKGRWLVGAVEQYFEENKNLEADEVEEYLEGVLDSEFDTVAEDGSVKEISQKFCKFYRLFLENKQDELQQILNSLPVTEVAHVHDPTNQSPQSVSDKLSKGQASGKGNSTAMEVDDEGWQTITKDNRRH